MRIFSKRQARGMTFDANTNTRAGQFNMTLPQRQIVADITNAATSRYGAELGGLTGQHAERDILAGFSEYMVREEYMDAIENNRRITPLRNR